MTIDLLRNSQHVRTLAGIILSKYLRLVWKTSRFVIEPADLYERLRPDLPVIITVWHGQHFLGPFMRRPEHKAKALVSEHRDGDINAIAAERLGMETIRGSGDHGGRFDRKGGVRAFVAMRRALQNGWNIVMTADVPKISHIAGRGIILLSRSSGRPIYPIGIATSRRIVLSNWDRSAINLPFSRGAIVMGEPVRVPADTPEDAIDALREQVETSLNVATARAYALVDAPAGAHRRG